MVSRPTSPKPVFDKRAILRAHPLFGKLGPDAIDRLASYSRSKTVTAGTTIFERGDPGDCLFAVCAGTIKISNRSSEGKDAVFNLINAGEIFGEVALLDGHERTADAQAITDCELMVIDRRDFIPMVSNQPDLALKVDRGVVRKAQTHERADGGHHVPRFAEPSRKDAVMAGGKLEIDLMAARCRSRNARSARSSA